MQAGNFEELQAGFYNAFAAGFGYSEKDYFQIIQPAFPLDEDEDEDVADQDLWDYLNRIPPYSLTNNTVLSPGDQFLSQYEGVIGALLADEHDYLKIIGESCWKSYTQAIEKGTAMGGPKGFRDWAMYTSSCAGVAIEGASALAQAMLDSVFAAQLQILTYKPYGKKSVDFGTGYAKMLKVLKKSPSRAFSVSSGQWDTDVSETWCKGSTSGLFGLWSRSSSTSDVSKKFAKSQLSLEATFDNVLPFIPMQGNWYNSHALGLAYHNKDKKPWNKESSTNWNNTFGGSFKRACASLLIVNKMHVKVTSFESYSTKEQHEIKQNKWIMVYGRSTLRKNTVQYQH